MNEVVKFVVMADVELSDDKPETYVAVSEANAIDLLEWLWYPGNVFGCLEAAEVMARCKRRLWPLARNMDPAVPGREEVGRGGNVRLLVLGREAGFLHSKTEELLKLAERAGPAGSLLYA